MFKVRPIRPGCPICKGTFESDKPAEEEKPKKKGEETSEPPPEIKKLYEMPFTRRMINQKLIAEIQEQSPEALFKQEMKLAKSNLLMSEV